MYRYVVCVVGCLVLVASTPQTAFAVLPPDILFSVGSQVAQFFSLVAVVVGGIVGSVALYIRTHVSFAQPSRLRTFLVSVVLVLCGIVIGVLLFENTRLSHLYDELIETLSYTTEPQVSENIQVREGYLLSGTSSLPWDEGNPVPHRYFGDSLFFYGRDGDTPIYLEVDLNRKQIPTGQFLHYYFGVGFFGGKPYATRDVFYSSSSAPEAQVFLGNFERFTFSDLSTRRAYGGSVMFGNTTIPFTLRNLEGDFVTRDTLAYTRLESIGDGVLTLDGRDVPLLGMQESVYSNDYTESIFFPEAQTLSTDTYQFVLFDEIGNFYLIDQSQVTPESPQYASHTWVLYKEKETGYTKKAFEAVLTKDMRGEEEYGWTIRIPSLKSAHITLTSTHLLPLVDQPHRQRLLVEGRITDDQGERTIGGFLHRLSIPKTTLE